MKCDGAAPSCGACVKAEEECRAPSAPDRRTAAGRKDPGLAKLKEENNLLAQENALLRAELASRNRDHGLLSGVQQAASLEAFNTSYYGASAASSILVPGTSPGLAPSTYAPPYNAQGYPLAYSIHGGPSSHAAPPAPLITGPDFDCIGDMFDEAELFPFGPYAAGGSSLDT
ncbi:hypothetical protein AURDEDRAFT_166586 [Auricularia subglabra TFB-10046 SS5]|nr:hypothetical protein AURDEDRAFT_166586 [Auricularia subglabra TFB-10046 SS5]